MLVLVNDHLEVEGELPTFWCPQVPIEVYDPWSQQWFPVDNISCTHGFVFYPARIRTQDLKNLKVRIKE